MGETPCCRPMVVGSWQPHPPPHTSEEARFLALSQRIESAVHHLNQTSSRCRQCGASRAGCPERRTSLVCSRSRSQCSRQYSRQCSRCRQWRRSLSLSSRRSQNNNRANCQCMPRRVAAHGSVFSHSFSCGRETSPLAVGSSDTASHQLANSFCLLRNSQQIYWDQLARCHLISTTSWA